jgi:hypothetical protein
MGTMVTGGLPKNEMARISTIRAVGRAGGVGGLGLERRVPKHVRFVQRELVPGAEDPFLHAQKSAQ